MSKPIEPAAKPTVETPKPEAAKLPKPAHVQEQAPGEIGGPSGPEPTRYGDWERKGIVSDF
jgi:hypothetical protein